VTGQSLAIIKSRMNHKARSDFNIYINLKWNWGQDPFDFSGLYGNLSNRRTKTSYVIIQTEIGVSARLYLDLSITSHFNISYADPMISFFN
jgi:hypothetical protein